VQARRSRCKYAAAVLLPLLIGHSLAGDLPQIIPLWQSGAPGAADKRAEKVRLTDTGEHIVSNVHAPSITAYIPQPAAASGAAVIVIPGGGHRELWMDHEGYNVAEFLRDHGVAAFVLKYRLAREQDSPYTIEGNSLPDVQRAIRMIRGDSMRWHIKPDRLGILGFSAGGELAALAAARYDGGSPKSTDPVERQSSRPSFQALAYPAIPSGLQFSPESPPAFLMAGDSDQPSISQGLVELYLSMRRAGVHVELHIYSGAGHGYGLRSSNKGAVAEWLRLFVEWLNSIPEETLQ
jgi:acetyl esterase/lipase